MKKKYIKYKRYHAAREKLLGDKQKLQFENRISDLEYKLDVKEKEVFELQSEKLILEEKVQRSWSLRNSCKLKLVERLTLLQCV